MATTNKITGTIIVDGLLIDFDNKEIQYDSKTEGWTILNMDELWEKYHKI